ncbi:MAG: TolC family protein, partial [Candidatus Aureabacteria bacterium]|nr:TolC family protein [Candidatus Auribacterota bacterium]
FLMVFIFICSFAPAEELKAPEDFDKEVFIANADSGRRYDMTIQDCISLSLENNLDIKISRIYPEMQNESINYAKSMFEPYLLADFNFHDRASPSNTEPFQLEGANLPGLERFITPEVSAFRDGNLDFSVGGIIPTGAKYELFFENNRYKTNSSGALYNPSYSSEVGISVTQPILRGFGIDVNTADIVIARNSYDMSAEEFRNNVMEVISKAKETYYKCIFAKEAYLIAEDYLKLAEELYEINRKRYEKGLISSVDLLESESAVAERKRYIIQTEAAVKSSEDNLKLITNIISDPEFWNSDIGLLDKPDFSVVEVSIRESLKDAFEYRPDYKSMTISLKNNDVRIKVAKNATLPTLDLTGSFGLNGLGKDVQKALEDIDYRHKDWYAGVTLKIPWGGGERADLRKKELEKAVALLQLKNLEHNIILDVRDKVREVNVQERQVYAARLFRDAETKNYDAQKKRFNAGQVSTHDMLDYQDKLSEAKLEYINALIDYYVALINLDKSTGLTLIKNAVRLEE